MNELIKYYQENSNELKSVFVLTGPQYDISTMRNKVSLLNSSKLTDLSVTNIGGRITIVPRKFMKLYKSLLFLKMSETMSKKTIIAMVDCIYDNKMSEFFESCDLSLNDNTPDLEF